MRSSRIPEAEGHLPDLIHGAKQGIYLWPRGLPIFKGKELVPAVSSMFLITQNHTGVMRLGMIWNMAGKIDCGASGGLLRDGHVALSVEQPQGLLLKMAR